MARAYDILRRLEDGELMRVASRSDLTQARHLAESLNDYWPAEYVVRDTDSGGEITTKGRHPEDWPQGVSEPAYRM